MYAVIATSLHRGVMLLLAMLLLAGGPLDAQIKFEHVYKSRDGNRYKEGLKRTRKKLVSGTLKITAFMMRGDAVADEDSVTLYFYSPQADGLKAAVYEPSKNYSMDPQGKQLRGEWNRFAWSRKLLDEVEISPDDLEAVVQVSRGNETLYLPAGFTQPDAQTRLAVTLKPDKDMVLDIKLTAISDGKVLEKWEDMAVKSDVLFTLDLPATLISGTATDYRLDAVEKTSDGTVVREHPFQLYIANKALLAGLK